MLGLLFLLFGGKARYIAILLVAAGLSMPFVVTTETLGRIVAFPAVSSFLQTIGLGGLASSFLHPMSSYSGESLKALFDKAVQEGKEDSFWNKFLRGVAGSSLPSGEDSLAMIRGGKELFNAELNVSEIKSKSRDVKGVVNEDEKSRGDNGDVVDLEGGLLAQAGKGLYGEDGLLGGTDGSLGQNLADRYGGGGSFSGPYMNRSMFSGSAKSMGAQHPKDGLLGKAISYGDSKTPLPGGAGKVNVKQMGKVSGFSWKNVGYKLKQAQMDARISSGKRGMYQLAETFSTTAAAYKGAAPEYQAAYTGATYDGTDVNAPLIDTETGGAGVQTPDTAFTEDMLGGSEELQELANKCAEAEGTYGANMSYHADQMSSVASTLGSPPKCCKCGAVQTWNGKIDQIKSHCEAYNTNGALLAQECQTNPDPMDCNSYSQYKISCCSKWKCWLSIILAILLIVVGILLLPGFIGIALIAVGVLMLASELGIIGGALGAVGAALTGFFTGTDKSKDAANVSVQINKKEDISGDNQQQ